MSPLSTLDIFYLLNCSGIGYRSINRILKNEHIQLNGIDDLLSLDESQFESYFPNISVRRIDSLKKIDKVQLTEDFYAMLQSEIEIIAINSAEYPARVSERLGEDAPIHEELKNLLDEQFARTREMGCGRSPFGELVMRDVAHNNVVYLRELIELREKHGIPNGGECHNCDGSKCSEL